MGDGAVIGINLGNTYGSIACINQHGHADVIANENGERQIATRIGFNGDQVYNGNEATPQLVRNAHNVIDNFVNLVGRTFGELTDEEKARKSAPVIDVDGTPSFRVQMNGKDTVLSAHDVLVRFIGVLNGAAKDFMSGVPIVGTVLSVPLWYNDAQIAALEKAAADAGLKVLQVIPVAAAALVAYGLTLPGTRGELPAHPVGAEGAPYAPEQMLDRDVVVVDFGGSSLDVTVVAARAGLYSVLAYDHDASIGGRTLDDVLVEHLAKEFTKKTKVSIGQQDLRAWAKLRNEAEITKRALSASNSAQCSVESLAEGIDFSASVNRMRLNLLASKVYVRVQENVTKVLRAAGLDVCKVDEVVLVGGAARLSGLAEQLQLLFSEESGTAITAAIDTDQVIARGNAIYADTIVSLPPTSEERTFIEKLANTRAENEPALQVPATKRYVGIVVDAPAGVDEKRIIDGQYFVTVVPPLTPLPARRSVRLPLAPGASASLVRIAEGTPDVRVDEIAPEPLDDEQDEDEEPPEPEQVRTPLVRADAARLVELLIPHKDGAQHVTLEFIVLSGGQVTVEAHADAGDVVASAKIGA
ncbi:Hsp70 protein that interacts with Zuo1p [Malassezia sp. CBS 17886]|nr:Hsp70 protein that interacts with Zuo1p [Malassezia sp. CBS 17886]